MQTQVNRSVFHSKENVNSVYVFVINRNIIIINILKFVVSK